MKYNKFYKVFMIFGPVKGNRRKKHAELVELQKKFKKALHDEYGQGGEKRKWRRNWRKIYNAKQGKRK